MGMPTSHRKSPPEASDCAHVDARMAAEGPAAAVVAAPAVAAPREIGGRDGPDPTRFGDWEKDGRCIDF